MSGVAAGDVLHQNCLPSNVTLNEGLCVVGNIAGFTSSAIWLIVLFPQLYWNWYRKSVEGLRYVKVFSFISLPSLAWAMANFLASFINCFFAFRFSLPMFSLFSAVYMPILEGLLLVQFILYGPRPLPHLTIAMFAVGLAAIIAISVLFPQLSGSLEWVAITLWSIELLPQLYLNLAQKSTQGQATGSLLLTFFGKTTDFTSAFLLNMPPQTHVLAFFSSSQAYVNIVQFLYYGFTTSTLYSKFSDISARAWKLFQSLTPFRMVARSQTRRIL